MNREQFISQRRQDWQRFEKLLKKSERSRTPKFDGEEVSEFSRLFRSLSYDLSLVRSRDWGLGISRYLNDLLARGHNGFYRSPPGTLRAVIEFFVSGFPRLFRENLSYFWVALALFVVPGLISGFVVYHNPSLAGRIMTGGQLMQFEEMYSAEIKRETGTGFESAMAGFYVYNNVGIAFRCFATGIFFGIGTIVFLIFNSIFLGTVTGFLMAQGHSERFFSFVISHGSFELTAIVISGAAGLVIGRSIVHPGRYTRWDALRIRGLVGVQLALGAGAMLLVAALIEGFWSPSGIPNEVKYVVGAILWVLVIVYLSFAGREKRTA